MPAVAPVTAALYLSLAVLAIAGLRQITPIAVQPLRQLPSAIPSSASSGDLGQGKTDTQQSGRCASEMVCDSINPGNAELVTECHGGCMLAEAMVRVGQLLIKNYPPEGRSYWAARFWDRTPIETAPFIQDDLQAKQRFI